MGARLWPLGIVVAVAATIVAAGDGSARTRAPRAPRAAPVVQRPVAVDRCPALEEQRSAVSAVLSDGGVALASGAVVRLVDIRVAEGGWPGQTLTADIVGKDATVLVYGGGDRWGRVPAAIRFAADPAAADPAPADLATRWVAAGWALVDAGERDRLCDPGLLSVEAEARARRLGSWASSPVVAADDGAAFAAKAGRFAVVEGRVVSVGERRERTYLNFGRDWSRDFSVVVPKRVWAVVKSRLVGGDGLRGRRVRVRGLVEAGERAPQIELSSADMLEAEAVEVSRR